MSPIGKLTTLSPDWGWGYFAYNFQFQFYQIIHNFCFKGYLSIICIKTFIYLNVKIYMDAHYNL